ncbi:MAG: LysM peptidoglycan-binding domain-containing protein [Balneolaceae bacterium]
MVYYLTLLAISFTILVCPADTLQAQDSENTHTVTRGETLYSIARQYEINVSDLRRWNSLESDELSVGQILRVTPPANQDAVRHTVQTGETLFSLSREYGVTIAEIQEWNQLENNVLDNGQELIIYAGADQPQASGTPAEAPPGAQQQIQAEGEHSSIVNTGSAQSNTHYTVKSGDNLTVIAREHGMTLQELRSLNNLESDNIRVGQQLLVRRSQTTPVVDDEDVESTPQGKFARYRLRDGETVITLLERYEMSEQELEALNPDVDLQSLGAGQRITVLLPPTRTFKNPYRKRAGLQDLGQVPVYRYSEGAASSPTTSGELYNPSELTAAHPNMALGNVVYLENPANGKGIFVKINDRFSGEGIKLSKRAFELLNFSSIDRAFVAVYLDE